MNQEIESGISKYKTAQAAVTEAEQKLKASDKRRGDLVGRLEGITIALDKAKAQKRKALADYAEGRSSEAVLSKSRREIESLERDYQGVEEMLSAVQSSIDNGDLADKQNEADALERTVWAQIEAELKTNLPAEVTRWIERLAAATFRASGRHICLDFPFGPYIPSEAEKERLSSVTETMKQEYFR